MRGSLSTMERFDYARVLAENLRGLKVAFVVREQLRDTGLFGQTASTNRGANVRVFTNIREGREWLGLKPADSELKTPR